ncbi:MAG: hypothetical protein ACRDBO_04255 [Lachnospiraceae bacterium]
MSQAITFAAVMSRGGADCGDPCHLSWYFCSEEEQSGSDRKNASPLFEIEQGAAFMVSVCQVELAITSGTLITLLIYKSIGVIETMRPVSIICQRQATKDCLAVCLCHSCRLQRRRKL